MKNATANDKVSKEQNKRQVNLHEEITVTHSLEEWLSFKNGLRSMTTHLLANMEDAVGLAGEMWGVTRIADEIDEIIEKKLKR